MQCIDAYSWYVHTLNEYHHIFSSQRSLHILFKTSAWHYLQKTHIHGGAALIIWWDTPFALMHYIIWHGWSLMRSVMLSQKLLNFASVESTHLAFLSIYLYYQAVCKGTTGLRFKFTRSLPVMQQQQQAVGLLCRTDSTPRNPAPPFSLFPSGSAPLWKQWGCAIWQSSCQ